MILIRDILYIIELHDNTYSSSNIAINYYSNRDTAMSI